MLHLNGDSTANILSESGLAGERLSWREALINGPTPRGLHLNEWLKVRAAHLAAAYELKAEDCERDLKRQEASLRSLASHEEVVL